MKLKDLLLITGNAKHPLSIRGIPVGHRMPKGLIKPKLAKVNVNGRYVNASSTAISRYIRKIHRALKEV